MSTKEPTKVKPKDDEKEGRIVLPPFKPAADMVEGTDQPRTEGLKGKQPKKAGKKKR